MSIHKSAIIDNNVQIGKNSKIWHFCHVSNNVQIGENCILGQNVYVGPGVTIGNNVKIQNNVSIYQGVYLDDNVFCGPSCVFTNVINPRSEFEKKNEFRMTHVCKNVSIGANATIICGVKLGISSFIGAGSLITKDTLPYSLNYGVPSIQKGWMSEFGEKMDFQYNNTFVCEKTNSKYILTENNIVEKIK